MQYVVISFVDDYISRRHRRHTLNLKPEIQHLKLLCTTSPEAPEICVHSMLRQTPKPYEKNYGP